MKPPRRFPSFGLAGRAAFAGAFILVQLTALAETASLVILHTNDLHDHVRPGYGGTGGLPYVAGYIESVRAGRSDVLVLDAGDVREKGDLVAFRSEGRVTYQAMKRIGYDAVTIGNHDHDAGLAGLRRYEEFLGQPLLNLNLLKPDGTPAFTASRIINVGGVKVGIIGMIVPRPPGESLDFESSGRALDQEARRLGADTHLVVALCHIGVKDCTRWSKLAPSVAVFVSGHTHEVVPRPVIVPETGAIIVQAGSYAEWVGRLELTIDLAAKKIVEQHGELVRMSHDTIPADAALLADVRREERALCPEASEVVAHTRAPIQLGMAWLAAAALREAAGTEIGFCHPGQTLRSPLPAGEVDVNALFLTGGQDGNVTVRTELTGAEITAYVRSLTRQLNDQTAWAGFVATRDPAPDGGTMINTNLQPDRRYSVIMPEREWTTRLQREVARLQEKNLKNPLTARPFESTPSPVTFIGAVTTYVKRLTAARADLETAVERLASAGFVTAAAPAPVAAGK
jgi:5'-nucleotidase